MNLKNLLLSIVAVILSICLVGLIFLATNQNALAKVHQTICTFSKANKEFLTSKIHLIYIQTILQKHQKKTKTTRVSKSIIKTTIKS